MDKVVNLPPYVINPDRELVTAWGFTGSTEFRNHTISPVANPATTPRIKVESYSEMS